MKERAKQSEVDSIADDRRWIRMHEARSSDQHRKCLDAVGGHALLVLAALENQITADVVEGASRRDPGAEPMIEYALHRAQHRRAFAILNEICGFRRRQRDSLRR